MQVTRRLDDSHHIVCQTAVGGWFLFSGLCTQASHQSLSSLFAQFVLLLNGLFEYLENQTGAENLWNQLWNLFDL
jgi:hypothetical protein